MTKKKRANLMESCVRRSQRRGMKDSCVSMRESENCASARYCERSKKGIFLLTVFKLSGASLSRAPAAEAFSASRAVGVPALVVSAALALASFGQYLSALWPWLSGARND